MNIDIEEVVEMLNKLQGAPAIVLVALACLCAGWVLRLMKAFPNGGIPLAIILLGAILNPLLSDCRSSALPLRIWLVRSIVVGAIIGVATWVTHKLIISRLESKIPWLGAALADSEKTETNEANEK